MKNTHTTSWLFMGLGFITGSALYSIWHSQNVGNDQESIAELHEYFSTKPQGMTLEEEAAYDLENGYYNHNYPEERSYRKGDSSLDDYGLNTQYCSDYFNDQLAENIDNVNALFNPVEHGKVADYLDVGRQEIKRLEDRYEEDARYLVTHSICAAAYSTKYNLDHLDDWDNARFACHDFNAATFDDLHYRLQHAMHPQVLEDMRKTLSSQSYDGIKVCHSISFG